MSLHDEYARVTPFEIAFPDRARLDELVVSVSAEAERLGVDATDPDAFGALPVVGSFLAEHHGDEVPRVALIQHGVLLFHAVHFARAEYPLYLLDTAAARWIVRAAPETRPVPPSHAGYVQLPQHLFWTETQDAQAPESIDGAFWTVSSGGRLHSLPIVGLRPDRPGFGALTVPDAPLTHAADWMHAGMRENGADYSSRLPGADLDDLYAIENAGEVLKLVARFFALVTAAPGTRSVPPSAPAGGPRPSSLSCTRVRLVA